MTGHAHVLTLAVVLVLSAGTPSGARQADAGEPTAHWRTPTADAVAASRPMPVVARSSVISARELASEPAASTLHTALTRLRPRFLKSRGNPELAGDPAVYVNGGFVGGLTQLHHIQAHDVELVRHYSHVESVHRFGPQARFGALEITLLNF